MKTDVIGLLKQVGDLLKQRRDTSRAFAIYELANNLRLLMRGEGSLQDWNKGYVGADREPLDIDKLLP